MFCLWHSQQLTCQLLSLGVLVVAFHQITLIVSVLGTPPPNQYSRKKVLLFASLRFRVLQCIAVQQSRERDFVANLPRKPKIPFAQFFPNANPLACDLLEKLLSFEPETRIKIDDALRHPYLEELHCEEDEPVCEVFNFEDFYFEYLPTTKEDLRSTRLLWARFPFFVVLFFFCC